MAKKHRRAIYIKASPVTVTTPDGQTRVDKTRNPFQLAAINRKAYRNHDRAVVLASIATDMENGQAPRH